MSTEALELVVGVLKASSIPIPWKAVTHETTTYATIITSPATVDGTESEHVNWFGMGARLDSIRFHEATLSAPNVQA